MLTPLTNEPERTLTTSYAALFGTQMMLGPRSLFLGLFLRDWKSLQHSYLKRNGYPYKQNQAEHAIVTIGQHFLRFAHQLWDLRNQALHKITPNNHHSFKRQRLPDRLRKLYDKLPYLRFEDRHLLDVPFEDRTSMSNTQLTHLIKFLTPVLTKSIKEEKDRIKTTNKNLRTLFPPNHTDTNTPT